jgi:hypothetical protein
MDTKELSSKVIREFNQGYEKGYHSKDYTWEDGIKFVTANWTPESADYTEGYSKGQGDRLRDEVQKWMC